MKVCRKIDFKNEHKKEKLIDMHREILTENTVDLALALYMSDVNPSEEDVLKHVTFIWIGDRVKYYVEDDDLCVVFNNIVEYKDKRKFLVCDFYKLEHIIGILKRLCVLKRDKRNKRGVR